MDARKFYVEVWDTKEGDTDYRKSRYFKTQGAAERYAKKVGAKLDCERYYVFLYIPMNDGFSDYYLRQDWTGGSHDRWLDEDIY